MQIAQIKAAFEQRGFCVSYFDTGSQAVAYLSRQTAGKTVSFGGSKTLEAIDAYDVLGQTAQVHWHWKGHGYMQAPDVYITSANAVSQTGELVNIDGAGNRVSATLYGPKEVYFVCGMNKLTPDLPSAIERAQNVAAPKNAVRLFHAQPDRATACAAAGGDKCYHCHAPHSICRAIVIHQGPMLSQEHCELVLIGETFGY